MMMKAGLTVKTALNLECQLLSKLRRKLALSLSAAWRIFGNKMKF